MKNSFILWLSLAFVTGGLIGAWGPSEELRAFKDRFRSDSAAAGKPRSFDTFARMVNIPDTAGRRRVPRAASTAASTDLPPAEPTAHVSGTVATNPPVSVATPRRVNPEDLRARIDEAAELWRTRSELVRAKAVDTLGLDADGEAGFDAAIARMNDGIRASVQAIADALAEEKEMTPELGVRLIGDLSTTMAETYDLIGETAGADRRDAVSGLQLVELVDPSVAEPLIEVQDKLEALPRGRIGR